MKTMKLAMVAILIACTTVCLASADGIKAKPKKVIPITFVKALQNPGLVIAMYEQLDPGLLNNNQHFYTFDVTYEGNIYRITGTYDQWYLFFHPKWKIKKEINWNIIGQH